MSAAAPCKRAACQQKERKYLERHPYLDGHCGGRGREISEGGDATSEAKSVGEGVCTEYAGWRGKRKKERLWGDVLLY
jgi:hypothetical protein